MSTRVFCESQTWKTSVSPFCDMQDLNILGGFLFLGTSWSAPRGRQSCPRQAGPPLQKSRLGRRDKLRPRDFGNRGRPRQHFSLRKDLHNTVGITNKTIASLAASQLSSGKDTASKCLPHSAADSRYDLPQLSRTNSKSRDLN